MTRDTQPGTILEIDDNVDIRESVKEFLVADAYSVARAADAEEGLRFFEEHPSSIMLLLADVRRPRMNGFELADRVLETESRLRILSLSGDPWRVYRGLECVAKPFRSAELIERVGRVLNPKMYSEGAASAA
jgi:DNA-binding response OmpR family regulator